MNALDTARGPRRAAPPGGLETVLRNGGRRYRRRRVLTSAGLAAALGVTGVGVAAPAVVVGVARGIAGGVQRYTGDPSFEGEEWVRTRLPYDEVADDVRDTPCEGVEPVRGWCGTLAAPATARTGVPVTLSFRLCRALGTEAATVTWEDFEEATFVANGPTPWTWGPPTNTAWHDVTFRPGRCRTWSQEWTPGAAGYYRIFASSHPERVSTGENPRPVTATVTVR